jgi:signal transduction histidine kinase
MLVDFIVSNREDLIRRTRAKVVKRVVPIPTESELSSGVPLFLDQLVDTLRNAGAVEKNETDRGAAVHGAALLGRGYTVAQVVHDYGDVCQAITEAAVELHAAITAEEFQILNLSLDIAIAQAVTEYMRIHDASVERTATERSGILAHELRNKVSATLLAFQAIRSGRAPTNGSVAAVIARGLYGMTALINRSLLEVRMESGGTHHERVDLRMLVEEAAVEGTLNAEAHGISLSLKRMESPVEVYLDPEVLGGALANVLQNAVKFTKVGGQVALRLRTFDAHARVEIEVEDQCGGLPPGKSEQLFDAFEQRDRNRSGLGLGLFVCRKGIDACGGTIRVRDRPGVGCIFTIDLPVASSAS